MLQSFLIGRLPVAMASVTKIWLHGFVRNVGLLVYIIYPSMVKMQYSVFELRLLKFLANKRPCIPCQPDQNNTHFLTLWPKLHDDI